MTNFEIIKQNESPAVFISQYCAHRSMWSFYVHTLNDPENKIFARICFELGSNISIIFKVSLKWSIPRYFHWIWLHLLFISWYNACYGYQSIFIVWSISHVYCIFISIAPMLIWYIKGNFNYSVFCEALPQIFLPT